MLLHAVCASHPVHFYCKRVMLSRFVVLSISLTLESITIADNKLHADISPIPGHHGYNAYKGQSFHWLHHRYFECNYGSELVPFDHMFGTYRKDL